jgi:hypothetical protein
MKNETKQSLTLKDLSEKGLRLTQKDAERLLPHISKIAQHGLSGLNEVQFEDNILDGGTSNQANMTAEFNTDPGFDNDRRYAPGYHQAVSGTYSEINYPVSGNTFPGSTRPIKVA